MSAAERRPDRLTVRAGWRPGSDFGADDARAPVTHMTYASADGHSWDALLAHPPARSARSEVLVLAVHGAMGNYTSGVVRRATLEMARRGYPTLSINTRMANFGVIYGGGPPRPRARRPRRGPRAGRAELGYGRVAMLGYGLGATMVAHHQALRRPPEVEAVCTLAHPASLPEALRDRWHAARRHARLRRHARARRAPRGSRRDGGRHRRRDPRVGRPRRALRRRGVDRPHLVGLPRPAGHPRHLARAGAAHDRARWASSSPARTSSSATGPSWPPPPARPASPSISSASRARITRSGARSPPPRRPEPPGSTARSAPAGGPRARARRRSTPATACSTA